MKLLLLCILASAVQSIGFTSLDVSDGMSHNSIISITQTPDGQMWLGTYDGLNRFDGFDIFTYRHSESDSTSVLSNQIVRVEVDSGGSLWVCSDSGVDIYDPGSDSFRHLIKQKNFNVYDLQELEPGRMLIATNRGVLEAADDSGGEMAVSRYPGMDFRVGAFCKKDSLLYFARRYTKEFFCKDLGSGAITKMEKLPQLSEIVSMDILSDGHLWISSNREGLCRVNLEDGSYIIYRHKRGEESLCSNFVRGISEAPDGTIWIATGYNLSILDPSNGTFRTVESDRTDPRSLSNYSITSIFRSSDGGIWLGTFYGGANYYHPRRNRFHLLEGAPKGLDGSIIGGMAVDSGGSLWIGTNRNGLFHYDAQKGLFRRFPLSDSPEKEDIKRICFSSDKKRAYVCTAFGGLNIISTDGSVRNIPYPNQVYDIIEENDRYAWICSMSGLFLLDSSEGHVTRISIEQLQNPPLFRIASDGDGHYWIGAENFLLRCRLWIDDEAEGHCSDCEMIPGVSKVQDLIAGKGQESTWAACRTGLYEVRSGEARKVSLGTPGSSVFRSICRDSGGSLWMGTDNGLYCYNPEDGSAIVFDSNDGLPGNMFNASSVLALQDGTLVFGSQNGAILFDPSALKDDENCTSPIISAVIAKDFRCSPSNNGEIVLKHRQNTFSIEFFAPDYVSWKQGSFLYRLEGWDPEWIEARNLRSASYTNVKGGSYRFVLQYRNPSGSLSDDTAVLQIRVLSPWYLTHLAITLYLFLGLCLIVGLIQYFVIRKEASTREEMNKVIVEKDSEISRLRQLSEDNLRSSLLLRFCQGREIADQDYDFLSRAYSIVAENISDENWSVGDLATALGIGRTRLHVRITEITGNSSLYFIKAVRFSEAEKLLKQGELPISEISSMVGFRTPAYFSTAFKAFTGFTPKQFQSPRSK